jgi:2-oxoglutarate dehydrogenase E1 component
MSLPTFATRWNADVIEAQYQRWRSDPSSVDESWRLFFEGFDLGQRQTPVALAAPSVDGTGQGGIVRLIDAYREVGHLLARLDLLSDPPTSHSLLELSEFGLREADLDKTFDTSHFVGLPSATLRQLLAALRETYCRTIGVPVGASANQRSTADQLATAFGLPVTVAQEAAAEGSIPAGCI